jgi:protein gp37
MKGEDTRWWDESWNPVVGCSAVSEGCARCYAQGMAVRFGFPWGGPRFMPERLERPLRRRKPTRYFLGSMTDLFQDGVEREWLDAVLDVVGRCPRHTFMALTKRPERMMRIFWGERLPDNLWLGVTAENQRRANERVYALLQTPARVRFVSVEPMLEPVFIGASWLAELEWVIAGPETGPGARECRAEWVEALAAECASSGVPFFDKRRTGWIRRECPAVR